ncbi:MAG: hypothetical protein JNJ71_15520 [Rubrivivax sp.]|nr:hypothetical protein [Rubrivivax sp.]
MRARRRGGPPRRPGAEPAGKVVALDALRIRRALQERERYKYVQPRLQREGEGWAIFSPNCSRSIHADGAEIAIAWLNPLPDGRWALHARDHEHDRWATPAIVLPLAQALKLLCLDPDRVFWP